MRRIALGILKVAGIALSAISLLVFVFVLGENGHLTTQIGSILFPLAAGYLVVAMIAVSLLSMLALVMDYRNKKRPGASLIVLTALSVAALAFGGVEFGIEKGVVRQNGGTVSLLGDGAISMSAQPDEQVVYAAKDGQELTISVYRNPENYQSQMQPVYIYIHGGGWSSGDSESSAWLHRAMADNGYVAFSVNYRLATDGDPNWERATEDIADAIKWIQEHAAEYGGDSNRILLSGESAGGQLALLYAGLTSSGNLDAPIPNAVAVMYPAIDMKWTSENGRYLSADVIPGIVEMYIGGNLDEHSDRLAAVDPMNYISEDFPPVYIIHGEKDSLVTCTGSEDFTDALNAAGGEAKLVLIPFANHGINTQEVVSLVINFAENRGLKASE